MTPIRSRKIRIKLFHIVSGDLWAGAEAMAFTLLRRLENNENVDLSVLVLNHGTLAERLRDHNINVHVIDERTHSFHQVLHKTRKLLHHCSPDIIHSHRYKENILALLARGMKKRIRLVCTQHGLPENYEKRVSLQKHFAAKAHLHLLSRFFSAVVAVSTDVQSFFLSHSGFKKENVAIIHNGIELPGTFAGRKMTAENFVIGSSGRLFHVKDYPLLFEVACSVSMHTREKVRFELAGEGPQRESLETLINRYGMEESFLLRGHQEDMDSFYQGLHLYINTSIHEGIPMTVLEALARGLPVIAPAVGGLTEIITNGVEGFLIPDRDPQSFAEKCMLLLKNQELRETMSQAARARIEQNFSASKMSDDYYRLYCRTLNM